MSTQVRDWLGEAGIVSKKRVLKDRRPYLNMFPRPIGKSHIIKKNAGVTHTVKFIPMMVKATLKSTENFVDVMIAPDLKQTCENLWRWVFEHIRYTPDGQNEVVRAPHRTASDGKGDCDCMTGFLDSCLENVRRKTGWMFWIVNRITKYKGPNFQHIYPIVITPTGERIILDCVTDKFNYEENYSAKEDHIMDLEFLNGFDGMELYEDDSFFDGIEEDEIGKLKIFQKAKETIKKVAVKTKEATKKVVHSVNRVNPATLVLRQGFLTAMKTNLMNVACRMKWSYLSIEDAKKKGLDMKRYEKLRKLRNRMEKTFYGAGGKPENLKEAILTGKGNAGKEVSGFGLIPIYAMQSEGLTTREILGNDLYEKESGGEVSGLGAVVAATAVASATAAIAAIAAALKEIGVVKKGEPDTDNPDAAGSTVDPKETEPTSDNPETESGTDSGETDSGNSNSNAKSTEKEELPEPKFLDDPMGWVKDNPGKTFLIAAATAGVAFGVYKLTKGKSKSEDAERNQPNTSRDRGYSNNPREEFRPITIGN
jgi:hypothetical protein